MNDVTRIADALERIATALEGSPRTRTLPPRHGPRSADLEAAVAAFVAEWPGAFVDRATLLDFIEPRCGKVSTYSRALTRALHDAGMFDTGRFTSIRGKLQRVWALPGVTMADVDANAANHDGLGWLAKKAREAAGLD